MEIAVDVPVSFYQQRNQLSGFSCTSDYGGNAPEELTLISITPKADNNQLYRMLLGFKDAPDASLTAGMNVAVTVGASVMADSGMVRLPMHAVFEDGGKSFVWIVTPDTVVEKRQVDVAGIDENGCIQIETIFCSISRPNLHVGVFPPVFLPTTLCYCPDKKFGTIGWGQT